MTGTQRALAPLNTTPTSNVGPNAVRVFMRDGEPRFAATADGKPQEVRQ